MKVLEFLDIKLNGKLVKDCQFISIDSDIRIYFDPKPYKDGFSGFDFCVLEWCAGGVSDDLWANSESTEVNCLFHGMAYFDGLRHIYMGHKETGNEGYIYYPSSLRIAEVFEKLRELEEKFCDKNQL